MHVAALVSRLRQNLTQGRSEPGVIVGDHELDTMQATLLEPGKEVPPARAALAIGELNRQYLASAIPVDADRDQHRLADDHAARAHPFVARVEDQIGKGFGQWPAGKLRHTGIHPLVDRTDRRGREAVATQLFGNRLHLAGGNAFVHTSPPAPPPAPAPSAGNARTVRWKTARRGPAARAARVCQSA